MWRPLMSVFLLACGCELPVLAGVVPSQQGYVSVRLSRNENVDVLFVIDTSASMAAKQDRVAAALPAVISALGNRGSYHFGAVSADLGAGTSSLFGCHPGGDGARLFDRAVGAGASGGDCPGTSDGSPFLVEDYALPSNNNRGGQGLPGALACMLRAGTGGCAVQQPLEAAHRILSTPRKDQFIRPDALLVVVYLTDGDDCSLPSESDLFDALTSTDYGPLSPFRCTRFGISWGFPPAAVPAAATGGPLAQPAPISARDAGLPGRLVDVSVYAEELRLHLKSDPNDVIVMAIAAPPEPFEIINAAAGSEKTAAPLGCGAVDGQTCLPALRHSCAANAAPELFGNPAVRLRALVDSVQHHYVSPVCSVSQSAALGDLSRLVVAQQTGPGCVPVPVGTIASPQCDVQDVSMGSGGRTFPIPQCGGDGATPCWRLLPDSSCTPVGGGGGGSNSQYRIDIDRGGKPAPAGTTARAHCATAAS